MELPKDVLDLHKKWSFPDRIKIKFTKPALDLDEKIALLKKRGLDVWDEEDTKYYLQHTWYYRLSWYFKHFQWKDKKESKDDFIRWTTFKDVYNLYIFDRKLRLLVFDAIEKIEVSLKANINDYMSKGKWVFWYKNEENFVVWFKWRSKFERLVNKIKEKNTGKDSEIVKNFFHKYNEDSLPSWMLFEELTIWEVSTIYKFLDKKDQEVVSGYYKINDFLDFWTWIVLLNKLRNISAHHSRLWNKRYNVSLKVNDNIFWDVLRKWKNPKNNNREEVISNFYNSVLIINYLLRHIKNSLSWIDDLESLFKEYEDYASVIWFKKDWKKDFLT